MSSSTKIDLYNADLLYRLLPEEYRNRDNDKTLAAEDQGHLKKYLEAFGGVLDKTRNTLEQRYYDSFPDTVDGQPGCQDWLLPYFADLFDAVLRSPFPNGQRIEISNAVRWAQRKGTVAIVDEVSDAITLSDTMIHEGWNRVATTARINIPALPSKALGEDRLQYPDKDHEGNIAQIADYPDSDGQIVKVKPYVSKQLALNGHPSNPVVTPDFRKHSRAVRTDKTNPSAQTWNRLGEIDIWRTETQESNASLNPNPTYWRQANRHSVPCFPDSYQDRSVRTVDVRNKDAGSGYYHPKNLLIFLPTPYGLSGGDPIKLKWQDILRPDQSGKEQFIREHIETVIDQENDHTLFRNISGKHIMIEDEAIWNDPSSVKFEKIGFGPEKFIVKDGYVEFEDCLICRLESEALPDDNAPRIILNHCLVGGKKAPSSTSIDSLMITAIKAPTNIVRCVYTTVNGQSEVDQLEASDCLFLDKIKDKSGLLLLNSCLRYSRLSPANFDGLSAAAKANFLTKDIPEIGSLEFSNTGFGILTRNNSNFLLRGAENSGELGVYNRWKINARIDALKDKLNDYLPAGIRPVIIYDKMLDCEPSQIK